MKKTTMLRKLLEREEILLVPGAYDAITAKVIQKTGFEAVYMSGSCTSSALLGQADVGFLTMTEMVRNAQYMADAIDIPVISDADTGYGNAINVMRTVREYERAGVAGIHIEDQVSPKKCGHMKGIQLVSEDEMISKIKAALEARDDPDFVVIARTDGGTLGINEAIERGRAYAKAGADMIFGEALKSVEDFKLFAKSIDIPLMADSTEWGKSPLLTAKELEDMGYNLVIFSTAALRVHIRSVMDLMEEIMKTGTQRKFMDDRMVTRDYTYQLVGLPEIYKLEDKFAIKR